ncbi:MAG: flavin reductase family protein [Cyclobacteriaceae bacterium]
MSNRRVFIKQMSVLPLLSFPIGMYGATSSRGPVQGQREKLEEAGPMIPPVPAILLTVNGLDGNPDEISVVWTFVVNGKPPQIGISVGDEHVAMDMIKKHKSFVLNVPTAAMIEQFDRVDMSSSKIANKFELSGLTKGKAQSINAPVVEEAPIHVECKVSHELRVPPMRTVFIADVTATTVLPNVCDENGRLIVDNIDFFGMTAGSGEFYTMGEKVGYIGKSVGRDDIKY